MPQNKHLKILNNIILLSLIAHGLFLLFTFIIILLQRWVIPIMAGHPDDLNLGSQPFLLPLVSLCKVLTYAILHFLIFKAYIKEAAKEEPSKLSTIGFFAIVFYPLSAALSMILSRLEIGEAGDINYLKSFMFAALQWGHPFFTAALLLLFAFGILLICYNWIFVNHKIIESEEA
ncbi:MAG: hypothetical protein LBS74_04240 [Oscillospiraceae bacterium]|jgi:hypothetical protein|nr:hypothetical protein [Oscillospiraceae bacterium]